LTTQINLTRGLNTIIDDIDYERISKNKFNAHKDRGRFYVTRTSLADGKKRLIYLHREIWEIHNEPIPVGKEIDHINGDGLDNRLDNLRLCEHGQNLCNRCQQSNNNSSKFKGVSWNKKSQKWEVHVSHEYLGLFTKEHEAALAYDKRAKELFGEYARLNFPGEET
jgi:hypothetical protein